MMSAAKNLLNEVIAKKLRYATSMLHNNFRKITYWKENTVEPA